MRGERATGKIQRNNYHHGSCGPSLTGKTMSVFFIFTQGKHRNVKNREVRSSLKARSTEGIHPPSLDQSRRNNQFSTLSIFRMTMAYASKDEFAQ